jgi:hypothetical protein
VPDAPSPDRTRDRALTHVLGDVGRFAQHLAGRPLRRYQLDPARAIVDSVIHGRGLTFTVMMSRQAGKNELSAEIEAYLLTLYHRRGGSIVKAAPTFKPQIVNSMLRLQEILNNDLTKGRWASQYGYVIALGKAKVFFFSGARDSQIVGATASLLLEVDEAQDFDEEKYSKDLRPMAASTNATTVLYGTAWTSDTLLERQRRESLRLEAIDGLKRDFRYPWTAVAEENPLYGTYVRAEIDRLGESHPLIRTQYLLDIVEQSGRLFTEEQLLQLQGDHQPHASPQPGCVYLASIDVAGEAEEAEDAALRSLKPRQDSTVVSIGAIVWRDIAGAKAPYLKLVRQYWWTGRQHHELAPQLVDLLKHVWHVRAVVIDATGVGAGLASFLCAQGALGERAHPFTFTGPSKSELGYQLLSFTSTGRLKLPSDDGADWLAQLRRQLQQATRQLLANNLMRWSVPAAEGHDDHLISLALLCEAAQYAQERGAHGRLPEEDR